MDGDLLPGALIAKRLGVSKQLVHWWVKSGKLPQADTARDGRPLYRLLDAALVEREMKRSPYSRRSTAAA